MPLVPWSWLLRCNGGMSVLVARQWDRHQGARVCQGGVRISRRLIFLAKDQICYPQIDLKYDHIIINMRLCLCQSDQTQSVCQSGRKLLGKNQMLHQTTERHRPNVNWTWIWHRVVPSGVTSDRKPFKSDLIWDPRLWYPKPSKTPNLTERLPCLACQKFGIQCQVCVLTSFARCCKDILQVVQPRCTSGKLSLRLDEPVDFCRASCNITPGRLWSMIWKCFAIVV